MVKVIGHFVKSTSGGLIVGGRQSAVDCRVNSRLKLPGCAGRRVTAYAAGQGPRGSFVFFRLDWESQEGLWAKKDAGESGGGGVEGA